MANNRAKAKFGSNFKRRAEIGSESKSTQSIGFGNLSQEDKLSLREKLSGNIAVGNVETTQDITSVLPTDKYVIKKIPRAYLKPAPEEWNFFSKPDSKKIMDLALSIYQNGLLQPIVVRKLNPEGNVLQILAGHTRDKVYDLLYEILGDPKYLEIEAIIFDYGVVDDKQAEEIVCDTNFMQRGNLPSRDMAKCIFLKAKRLKETAAYGEGSVADKIAEIYKIKRTSVFMWKKLANLTDELQQIISDRKITLRNAYKLASLSKENQLKLIESCYNLISNESIRNIDPKASIDEITKKMEEGYGVEIKSYRFEIPENLLHDPKDKPILLFIDAKKRKEILEAIQKIDGAYTVEN